MTREEREMEAWQRGYDQGMPHEKVECARAALAAFREAFPGTKRMSLGDALGRAPECNCHLLNAEAIRNGAECRYACSRCATAGAR